jgi:hypothetical protein
MKRKTKSEMVLEIYDREAMGEVSPREIAQINDALRAEFGEGGAMTPAEIARILADEDLPVRFDQVFRMAAPDDYYDRLLEGLPRTDSLLAAERSLDRLDALCRRFQLSGDRRGMRLARARARRAQRESDARAGDRSLTARGRAEQAEIARWLEVWLQSPDLFPPWLELRKSSAEFRSLFS